MRRYVENLRCIVPETANTIDNGSFLLPPSRRIQVHHLTINHTINRFESEIKIDLHVDMFNDCRSNLRERSRRRDHRRDHRRTSGPRGHRRLRGREKFSSPTKITSPRLAFFFFFDVYPPLNLIVIFHLF